MNPENDPFTALAADEPLASRHRDHALTGDWRGHRDCHVRPDLVLIYRKPDARTLVLTHFGDMAVSKVDGPQVRDALVAIWLDKPETVRRVRQRIVTVIDWAIAKGYRDRPLPIAAMNKALWWAGLAFTLGRQRSVRPTKLRSRGVARPVVTRDSNLSMS